MKLTVRRPVQIEPVAIRCQLAVRYEEEDIPNDFPLRKGDMWEITIDLETGQIRDWPGMAEDCEVDMKITDCGTYSLLDAAGRILKEYSGYVPNCIPGRYGDYIEFKVSRDGKITNWDTNEDEVFDSFFNE